MLSERQKEFLEAQRSDNKDNKIKTVKPNIATAHSGSDDESESDDSSSEESDSNDNKNNNIFPKSTCILGLSPEEQNKLNARYEEVLDHCKSITTNNCITHKIQKDNKQELNDQCEINIKALEGHHIVQELPLLTEDICYVNEINTNNSKKEIDPDDDSEDDSLSDSDDAEYILNDEDGVSDDDSEEEIGLGYSDEQLAQAIAIAGWFV